MVTIRQQFKNNAVALISLFIAISSLGYNTWRNETTEEQRNVRHAAFRVLENLGELQQVVDYRHYYLPFEANSHQQEGELRLQGFGHVSMVHDLMGLMPAPAPEAGHALQQTWQGQFSDLDRLDPQGLHTVAATAAERDLNEAIEHARQAVLGVLRSLE